MRYDLAIASMTVYMEASGESKEGQQAILSVLMNRLKSGRWGSSLSSVCLWSYQFSCWNSKDAKEAKDTNRMRVSKTKNDDKILIQIEQMVQKALAGELQDNTNGALFYLNPSLCNPEWDDKMQKTAQIGQHAFFKEKI